MRRFFLIGITACLCMFSLLSAQTESVYQVWGQVFGTADTTDDFLIYDATIPDCDTTCIYIVGLSRNGNAFPLKERKGTFFYEKDSTTDAFFACFSIYGQLLWSTYLPPAQNGYINGFASCVRSVSDSTIIVVCNDYEYQSVNMPLEDFRKTIPVAGGKLHLMEFHKKGTLLREKTFITNSSAILPRIFDIYLTQTDTIAPLKMAGHHLVSYSVSTSDFSISDGCQYSLSLDWKEDKIFTPTFRSNTVGSAVYSAAYYHSYSPVTVNYVHFGDMNQSFAISEKVGEGVMNVGYYHQNYYIIAPQKTLAPAAEYDFQSHFAEAWEIHNEYMESGFQYYASPTYTFWVGEWWNYGRSHSGTVQNTQKFNDHYIVQGVHCKNYQNGFFREGDDFYAYSHNDSIFFKYENKRNPLYTAVPYLYIYDKAFEQPSDSTQPVWGTFLDMDWYFEDFFFRTDLSRPKNLFMPYDPILLTSGNKFFLIGNSRKIGDDLLTSASSDTSAHHQGVILAFNVGCPAEKTAFRDVRFLCPGDSVELKVSPDYAGFKFRF
ncbi:MAG: hypothetical protein NC324_10865, partial [Bacteroides sp.]|nr:hypothetical protein [Bacteroides sp.]